MVVAHLSEGVRGWEQRDVGHCRMTQAGCPGDPEA